jgi:hypothetical protein
MVFLEFNQLLLSSCIQFKFVNVVPKYFISATFSKVFVGISLLIQTYFSQEILLDLISHIHVRNSLHLPRDNDVIESCAQQPPKRFIQHPEEKVLAVSATAICVKRHRQCRL